MRTDEIRATVDLHCHILPGIDDGAQDLDDALAMARQAERDGITAVCATPHIRHDHDVRIDELPDRVQALNGALADASIGVRVLPGGEVASSALDGLDEVELRAVSLGGSGRWILLEPPPGPLDGRLEEAVGHLHRLGFRALVAHPERHGTPDLVRRLRSVISRGALVQVTAAYLTCPGAVPTMLDLARAGTVHVLGSDAHSSRAGRSVALSSGLAMLERVDTTAAQIGWIARTAPEAIIEGELVSAPY